jgi:hypothetical protein
LLSCLGSLNSDCCSGTLWFWFWVLARRWRGTRSRELFGLSGPNMVVYGRVEDISGFILSLSFMQECMDRAYLIYDESKEQYCKILEFDLMRSSTFTCMSLALSRRDGSPNLSVMDSTSLHF